MSFITVGTNHKYSPIAIRERLSFPQKRLPEAVLSLRDYGWVKSGVILSTCNRVELYAHTPDYQIGAKALKEFLADYHHQELRLIEPYLYAYIDRQAILHLFNVAAGLDSQIIGESQILEQVRSAYNQARAVGALDNYLDRVFGESIKTALRVREETDIAKGKTSIASIVLDIIKMRCGPLKDKKLLLIGLGKVTELLLKYLKAERIRAVFVSNRTYEKAALLAEDFGAQVVRFSRLREYLMDTDIIISATASPHLILRKNDLSGINKPLLIVDLAVPRDIDPRARDIDGVSLYCLDDLGCVIEKNIGRRRLEIPFALKVIEEEADKLCPDRCLEWEPEPAGLP